MEKMIKFDEWKKLDIRIGEIKEVKDHPNADKLYILKVDVGNEERSIVAGIKKYYNIKELIGKKIVVFCNLEERELRGIKSEGMILAAVKGKKVVLLKADKNIEVGSKIE